MKLKSNLPVPHEIASAAVRVGHRLVGSPENESLVSKESDYQSRFENFERLNRAIGASSTVEELLMDCARSIPRIIRSCDFCNILLYDEVKQKLYLLGEGTSDEIRQHIEIVPKVLPVAESITGDVVRTRTHGVYYNVDENQRFFLKSYRDSNSLTGMLAMPMLASPPDRVLGCINLYSTIREHEFSESEIQLLKTIADVIAVAVVNLEQKLALMAESRVAELLLRPRSHDTSLDELADMAARTVSAESCSIFMLESDILVLKGTTGIEGDFGDYSAITYHLSEGLTGWVAKTGKCLRLAQTGDISNTDAPADVIPKYKFVEALSETLPPNHFDRGFLCIPISAYDDVIGVVRVYGKRGDLPFTQLDEMQLTAIGRQIGRLWLDRKLASRQRRRCEAIIRIVDLLHSQGNEREVLRKAVAFAMDAVQGDTASIAFHDPADNMMHFHVYLPIECEDDAANEPRAATEETLIGEVFVRVESRNVSDMRTVESANPIHPLSRSSLLVPLTAGGIPLGVLACDSFHAGFFTDEDVATLECIGHVIATVIQLNRLLMGQQKHLREKDDLMVTMVHQLVAPIAGMQSVCEEIFENSVMTSQEWRHIRRSLSSSCKLASSIALNFRSIRKMMSDPSFELLTQSTSLWRLIMHAVELCSPKAAERDIRIAVASEKLLLQPHISADVSLLSQVFINLLENAVKYSLQGTTISVFVPVYTELDCTICIQNRGIPIAQDQLEEVFERGFRAPIAQAWAPVGNGLGLAVARQIVIKHGGVIWAKSELLRHRRLPPMQVGQGGMWETSEQFEDRSGAAEVSLYVKLPYAAGEHSSGLVGHI